MSRLHTNVSVALLKNEPPAPAVPPTCFGTHLCPVWMFVVEPSGFYRLTHYLSLRRLLPVLTQILLSLFEG